MAGPTPRRWRWHRGRGGCWIWRGVFADVPGAIADCDFVFATTARGRELVKPVVTPERAMEMTRAMAAAGKRVGFLLGPERAGLENEDVALANAIVTVPVNPEFPSLNLAQCALLLGYEWRRQTETVSPEIMGLARTEFASRLEVERLSDHFEERLELAGFFYPPDKAAHMKLNLRNMFARLGLTRAEVQTFHGMLRQIAFKLRQMGE